MVTLAIGVFVVVVTSGAVWFLAALTSAMGTGYRQERREARLRKRARKRARHADDQLADALHDAKLQMNRAAGQSWRNPFE